MSSSVELCCVYWIVNCSRLRSILEREALGEKCNVASLGESMNLGKCHRNFKNISFIFVR